MKINLITKTNELPPRLITTHPAIHCTIFEILQAIRNLNKDRINQFGDLAD
ncbi:MAG: hypothetical protein ACJZ8E_06560 [Pseudohongiellaceae bacterium]